jgi:hypothetical protein
MIALATLAALLIAVWTARPVRQDRRDRSSAAPAPIAPQVAAPSDGGFAAAPAPPHLPETPAIPLESPTVGEAAPSPSRPANAYERLVLTAADTARRRNAAEQKAKAELEAVIDRLLCEPEAVLESEWLSLKRGAPWTLHRLASEARSLTDPELQTRALEALERLADKDAAAWLRPFCHHASTRREAIRLMAPHASLKEVAGVLANEADPQIRQTLLSDLLARNDRAALAVFLNVAQDRAARPEAMRAARLAASPPIDLLCEAIASGDYQRQLTAACVLGQIADAAATDRLAMMVLAQHCQQPALAGLLGSPHPRAAAFLARAERRPDIAASLHSLRVQLAARIP